MPVGAGDAVRHWWRSISALPSDSAAMSRVLAPTDRQRLAKLLGMLGSDYAGERDAAGLAAHRFIRERDLSWDDVIHPDIPATGNRDTLQPWRATVAECLRQPGALRAWERQFLRSLSDFPRISQKQRSVLGQIAERVLRRAVA
jgi:hypothetical protein